MENKASNAWLAVYYSTIDRPNDDNNSDEQSATRCCDIFCVFEFSFSFSLCIHRTQFNRADISLYGIWKIRIRISVFVRCCMCQVSLLLLTTQRCVYALQIFHFVLHFFCWVWINFCYASTHTHAGKKTQNCSPHSIRFNSTSYLLFFFCIHTLKCIRMWNSFAR